VGQRKRFRREFDRLKSRAGEWEATTTEGKTRVVYQVISNGTALLETIVNGNMVSVYHPDGDTTLMTHYCGAGSRTGRASQRYALSASSRRRRDD